MIKMTIATLVAGSSILYAGADMMQKYDVKSGKISYELKGSGNVMGMVKIDSVGKKRVIFDNYGANELVEQVEMENTTTMGETKTKKTHTLDYMKNAVIYKVDFEKKIIKRMKNTGAAMAAAFSGGKSLKDSAEVMMKKMGGKKIGTEKILGYTCEVWDLMGTKQCMYKGVPLKIETNIMGMKKIELATKAEFDITLTQKNFNLPDFPVYEYDIDKMMDGGKPQLLDKSKLDEMDSQATVQAKVDATEGAEAMKGMVAGMQALRDAGVDLQSGKELTSEQIVIMQEASMNAMGGIEKMKSEILNEADPKMMRFAKECFGNADTLKEANICVDKGNQMFHEDEEHMTSWTKADKNEMIDEMAKFEKALPCIKAAQTMRTLRGCMGGMQ